MEGDEAEGKETGGKANALVQGIVKATSEAGA